MKSIRKMPERALSWAENDSNLCRERSNNHLAGRTQKALTVDYSPVEGDKGFNTSLVSQTIAEDDVFDREGMAAERSPLIQEGPEDEHSKDNLAKRKTSHDCMLHRQDAVENIPLVNLQKSKSLDV
jgi:hypothetical protein